MNEATTVIPVRGQLFKFGQVAITAAAMQAISPEDAADGLSRHASGDWGTVCKDDWESNDLALGEFGRIFSTCEAKGQPKQSGVLDFHLWTQQKGTEP